MPGTTKRTLATRRRTRQLPSVTSYYYDFRLVLLVVLAVAIGCCEARPRPSPAGNPGSTDLETVGSELRQDVVAPELLVKQTANYPQRIAKRSDQPPKKVTKNSAGKENEGGYYRTFGSDADGEKGFVKKTYSKGDHGYKHYDTFHKQHGDKYGYAEQEELGAGAKASKKHTSGHKRTTAQKRKSDGDHEGAGTTVDEYYADDDGGGEYFDDGGGDESSSYSEGDSGGYSYAESSDDGGEGAEGGDGGGSYEGFSSGEAASGEDY